MDQFSFKRYLFPLRVPQLFQQRDPPASILQRDQAGRLAPGIKKEPVRPPLYVCAKGYDILLLYRQQGHAPVGHPQDIDILPRPYPRQAFLTAVLPEHTPGPRVKKPDIPAAP